MKDTTQLDTLLDLFLDSEEAERIFSAFQQLLRMAFEAGYDAGLAFGKQSIE